MFTKLYLDTTNPKLELFQLFKQPIVFPMIISIVFHTVIYVLFLNMVSYIFTGKNLSLQINIRLVVCLLFIMIFGFIARFFHVKEIYKAYNEDIGKTRIYLDNLYVTWIFIS